MTTLGTTQLVSFTLPDEKEKAPFGRGHDHDTFAFNEIPGLGNDDAFKALRDEFTTSRPSIDVPDSDSDFETDLIFLEVDYNDAKGGNGGGKGGNGGGGTDTPGGGNGGGKGGGKGGNGGNDGGDTLTNYISGPEGGYNIEIVFSGEWNTSLQQHFIDSAEFLSSTILSDLQDVMYNGQFIDDITIDASMVDIDGSGGVLGRAGATAIRTSNYLPVTAIMEFDIADATDFDQAGLFDDIVLHEMIHSIGFSSGIWDYMSLISGAGTDSPEFTGANAALTYASLFDGTGYVPLEQDGGAGTRDSHWDEQTFGNELMTGYINNSNYLSDMSIAALEDMGYDTTWDAADYA